MEDILSSLSTYGYILLFFYSLGGGFFGLVAAGVLSYAGKMDLTTSILVAMTANFLGDTMLFYLSRYNKYAIKPYLKSHRRKFALSHLLMKKHGSWIILFQKFIYGVKTLIPIAIGFTKYSFTKFTIINFLSTIVWALFFGILSYSSGEVLMKFASYIKENPWIMPLILFTFLYLIWLYFHKATKKKSA